MNEEQLLTGVIEDKIKQCSEYYSIANSLFLDLRQRTQAERICSKHRPLQYGFYGGYEDAERTLAVFFPEYIDLSEKTMEEYLKENEEDNPLTVLTVQHSGARSLTHRDYLGSLIGLGIKREMIGDILVADDRADIFILKEISDFLLTHYFQAGRVSLTTKLQSIDRLIVPERRVEEKKDTVASLRLDNVIASAFSLSRGKAVEAIAGGIVFVNGLQMDKPERIIKEGDKLVLRGKGKAVLKAVSGLTRKDRIFIIIEKYL